MIGFIYCPRMHTRIILLFYKPRRNRSKASHLVQKLSKDPHIQSTFTRTVHLLLKATLPPHCYVHIWIQIIFQFSSDCRFSFFNLKHHETQSVYCIKRNKYLQLLFKSCIGIVISLEQHEGSNFRLKTRKIRGLRLKLRLWTIIPPLPTGGS